jgi:twitching motility protein PilT
MILHTLFDAMLEARASDLHLSPQYPPMVRVRGDLTALPGFAVLAAEDVQHLVFDILTPAQQLQFTQEHDLDFAYPFLDKARFRGNVLRKQTGVGAVFRTIPSRVLTLAELHTPATIAKLAQATSGLILVTGPTGSGKSTTLAGMLDAINSSRKGHILTVEDPVEFVHVPKSCAITHREVGRDVASFADAIRSASREDVDVLLVGELRGPETMRLALQAASSGVLVFATVHTNSAPATIERFINAFGAEQQPAIRGMLAECLTAIVAQQLLKTADGAGRIAVQEVLVGTKAVSASIRENKISMLTSLIQSGRGEGMQSMDDTLYRLVQDKKITAADALAKAVDKENFLRYPGMAELAAAVP